MNRNLLLLVFLVVSDRSSLPFQMFLRKVLGTKQQISWIHVCTAWPRGFRSLSCQRRRQLLRTLTIERSRDGKTLLSEEVLNIRMNHIHFHEGSPFGMIIKVEKSKTDQLRQGHQVVIA